MAARRKAAADAVVETPVAPTDATARPKSTLERLKRLKGELQFDVTPICGQGDDAVVGYAFRFHDTRRQENFARVVHPLPCNLVRVPVPATAGQMCLVAITCVSSAPKYTFLNVAQEHRQFLMDLGMSNEFSVIPDNSNALKTIKNKIEELAAHAFSDVKITTVQCSKIDLTESQFTQLLKAIDNKKEDDLAQYRDRQNKKRLSNEAVQANAPAASETRFQSRSTLGSENSEQ